MFVFHHKAVNQYSANLYFVIIVLIGYVNIEFHIPHNSTFGMELEIKAEEHMALSSLDSGPQGFTSFMSITQNYFHIVLEKDRVLHSSITCVTYRPFQDKHHMTFPYSEYWHAVDAAVGVILGS